MLLLVHGFGIAKASLKMDEVRCDSVMIFLREGVKRVM